MIHKDNDGNVQRKLIRYELQIPYSPETEKTSIKKESLEYSIIVTTDDTVNTTVDVDWMPVAQFFDEI